MNGERTYLTPEAAADLDARAFAPLSAPPSPCDAVAELGVLDVAAERAVYTGRRSVFFTTTTTITVSTTGTTVLTIIICKCLC